MEKIIMSYYAEINNLDVSKRELYEIEEIGKRLSKSFQVTIISNMYPGSESGLKNGVYHQYVGLKTKNELVQLVTFRAITAWFMLTKQYDIWLESDPTSLVSCMAQLFTKRPIIGIFQHTYKQKLGKVRSFALKLYRYGIVTSEFAKHQIQKINPRLTVEIIPYAN